MSLILASRATVYDRYAISRKFTAQETAINVIQGNISLLISASEIEELKNGDKTMYSKLSAVEMDLNSINLAVSSSEYKDINGVLSAITQAKASIELNSQEIELKVSKDSLISTINQSAEAVSIDANKINLNGVVTANENFKILQDGSMEAKNGRFAGTLQAASGTFTGALQAATGTFMGSLQAAAGTFTGSLQAATGTFTGELLSDSGSFYTRINNGRIQGGKHGNDLSGDSGFNAYYSPTGVYGLRLGGKGIITIYTPYLGIGDYINPSDDGSVYIGKSGSIYIKDANKTLTFHNGIMVTAL